MPLRVSIPIFPGVRYTASTRSRRRRKGEPNGCAVMIGLLLAGDALFLAIKYWYVTVPVLAAVAAVVLLARWANRRQQRSGPARHPSPAWHPMCHAPRTGTWITARHREFGPIPVMWSTAWKTWTWVGPGGLPEYLPRHREDELLGWQEIKPNRSPPNSRKAEKWDATRRSIRRPPTHRHG